MQELAPLIYDLAVMLGLAGIVVLLFQRIRQPVVLGYLVAGMIVGPYTPPHALVKDIANIQILSELGVIFLMFSLGLEFSFQKLTRVGFSASVTGVLEVIFMLLIGYGTGALLGWSHYDSLFLGAALSISSTTIIIKAIDELGLKTKRFAELIFGVLIVEDLLAILLLVALSTVVISKHIFTTDMAYASVRLLLVVGAWFLVGYFLVPSLFRRIAHYINQETLTIISVALCLFLVCFAAKFHYSTALGAFIMGSILAETHLQHRIEKLIRPIRDIFAAVFFISVGMLINPTVILDNWPTVLLLSLVTILGKIVTTSTAAFLSCQPPAVSIRTGFGMAQIGEFSFIIVALGLSLHVTSHTLYPLVVAVAVITTFTTPYLIRVSGYMTTSLKQYLPKRWQYVLASYAKWVSHAPKKPQPPSFFNKITLSVLVNGILVAVIFKLLHYLLLPLLMAIIPVTWVANVLCLFIVLVFSSPFIWGMLFSYQAIGLPHAFMLRLVALTEITILSVWYFHSWIIALLFFCMVGGFFLLSYRPLAFSYHWFEEQLINNIKTDEEPYPTSHKQVIGQETYLIDVAMKACLLEKRHPFVGKTIRDCHPRGELIIGLERHHVRVFNPHPGTILKARDLILLVEKTCQPDSLR